MFDTQELGTTDPVCEHWACLAKVLNFKGPVEDHSPSVWSANWQALNRRKEPWRVVAGPLSATRAYLLDLRVDGNSLEQWSVGNRGVKVRDGEANLHPVKTFLKDTAAGCRHASISQQFGGDGAEGGMDWTVSRKLLKRNSKNGRKRSGLRAVWQAALACTGPEGINVVSTVTDGEVQAIIRCLWPHHG